jgi:hypothetical protein
MYGICQICEKDLCKDHAIPAPEINGGVICADCNQTYAEDIKNLKANKQATHDALVGLNKAGKVYDKIVADLIERVKASKQKKQNK